ncbi:MAG: hypothetical protein ABSH51_25660 [Solirubrobacteraceae bacterium]
MIEAPRHEPEAQALLAILLGPGARRQPRPWRRAIPGGQRHIELRAEP